MTEPYRYTLGRSWSFGVGRVCWVMLNPSTADDTVDDPTIRRVVRFSQDAGYRGLVVVNLFAVRATSPKLLAMFTDPIGPENSVTVEQAMHFAVDVVFAWGAWRGRLGTDAAWIAQQVGRTPLCLGTTKDGHPRHPLYVSAATPLVPYHLAERAA